MLLKNIFTDSLFLKIVLAFSALGFFLSLIAAFFSGVTIFTILLRAFFSSLFTGVLGAIIFFLLESMFPEWRDAFSGYSSQNSKQAGGQFSAANQETFVPDFDEPESKNKSAYVGEDLQTDKNINKDDFSSQHFPKREVIQAAKKNKQVAEDEILVEGVPIKNDPAVMSEAVRQVLDQDS